jgi:hypothetical protein
MSLYEEINKNGFVIFKNILECDSLMKARDEILKLDESFLEMHIHNTNTRNPVVYQTYKKDPFTLKSIQDLFIGTNFIKSIKNATMANCLTYFGDSTVMIGEGQRGFHKDNIHAHQNDMHSIDYAPDYDLYRLGIYLQDTKNYSGGIQFRKNSHMHAGRWKGTIVNADAELGDVVCWKLTSTHSGNTLKLRLFPSFNIIPRVSSYLPRTLFKDYEDKRVAVFITFAAKGSDYLKPYLTDLRSRKYFKDFQIDELPRDLIDCLHQMGFEVRSNSVS